MRFLDDLDAPLVLGVVPTDGRGSLPFSLLHGESLVAIAAWAMGEAEVVLLDFNAGWDDVRARKAALVVHDPLCPGIPIDFLRDTVDMAVLGTEVVVGVRPVTDTVKETDGDRVGETVDRDALVTVCSPLVLPPTVVDALDEWPDLDDLPALVDRLRARFPVRMVEVPAIGRRVVDDTDVRLLEAIAVDQRA